MIIQKNYHISAAIELVSDMGCQGHEVKKCSMVCSIDFLELLYMDLLKKKLSNTTGGGNTRNTGSKKAVI